ncbi:MAG: lysine exporter LysO family protein [Bacteroidales bacterium]|nr:lysine exporter LysO family protein [Bacteroidales bacterium]
MKGSIVIVVCFVLGILFGVFDLVPDYILEADVAVYVLYALIFAVGISIGCDKNLKHIIKNFDVKLLLLPLATIVGTLSFSALVALFLSKWSVTDCMAVGSGFAYYSLSSILITELKEASLGVQLATELGTIALISNIIRELYVLLGAPLLYKVFGKFAPICVGGATTADTTLPIITNVCGKDLVFASIFHGLVIDFSVPFMVSFFCSL